MKVILLKKRLRKHQRLDKQVVLIDYILIGQQYPKALG
jgi:hypothetical protein